MNTQPWNKPHPFIFNTYSVVVPSVITFLILIFLSPFSFSELPIYTRTAIATIISVIVALSILGSVHLLKLVAPRFMSEEKWTIGKEFLLFLSVVLIIILLISTGSIFISSEDENIFDLVLKTTGLTLAISAFPILISILFEQYRHQKKQLQKAASLTTELRTLTQKLHEEKISSFQNDQIQIRNEKDEVELQLETQDLLFMKSEGNYIEVFYKNQDKVEKQLIRNRLKSMENQLPESKFLRCHNRYMVNGGQIMRVEGNARNLSLFLKGIQDPIPVSRSKVNVIDEYLKVQGT